MMKNSVSHAAFFRNHTFYDCHLWYTCEIIISPNFFFIFLKFWFFGLLEGGRQKTVQNDKFWLSWFMIDRVRNYKSYDYYLWCMCVKWYIFRHFFLFFKSLIFWVVRGVKEEEIIQNNKKFCLLCSTYQEPCIIWLSFMVQTCKIIISILKFWFSGLPGGWKGKKWLIMTTKFCLCLTLCLRNCTSYDCDFWYTCVKWYLQQFFWFFKILIFGFFMGVKGQKMT